MNAQAILDQFYTDLDVSEAQRKLDLSRPATSIADRVRQSIEAERRHFERCWTAATRAIAKLGQTLRGHPSTGSQRRPVVRPCDTFRKFCLAVAKSFEKLTVCKPYFPCFLEPVFTQLIQRVP
jgi:hypothetical protein